MKDEVLNPLYRMEEELEEGEEEEEEQDIKLFLNYNGPDEDGRTKRIIKTR